MIRPDPDFPSSFAQARERFLAAARARGARLESVECPAGPGREGEALATDVAVLGSEQARSVLLVTSGTHGVEGYCGSGIQHALLREGQELEDAVRAGQRVVLVHALNPWGFSWGRRVTQENVDLNRNVRDFPVPEGPDADYEAVHDLMLPARWPWDEANAAAIEAFVARHGAAHLQYAISHGQWSRPEGMFFCGTAPTWSHRTLRALLRRHAGSASRLFWIDVHTGLGPRGHGEMIYNGRNVAADLARTRACWGPAVTSIFDGTSVSATVSGWIGNAAYDECPGAALAAMAIEYGTLPFAQVTDALRRDHWTALHAPSDAQARQRAREQMMQAFFVDDDDWKAKVLGQARQKVVQAVQADRAVG
jgi:hypothetical protein